LERKLHQACPLYNIISTCGFYNETLIPADSLKHQIFHGAILLGHNVFTMDIKFQLTELYGRSHAIRKFGKMQMKTLKGIGVPPWLAFSNVVHNLVSSIGCN